MASNNQGQIGDLIGYAVFGLVVCGLASAYFLEPDFFPRDTTWFDSLKYSLLERSEGDQILGRTTLYWVIAKYALLIGLTTLVVSFVGAMLLTKGGEGTLNVFSVVWAVLAALVLLATVWLRGPSQIVSSYSGIWQSATEYIAFDLTSRNPTMLMSNNGKDYQSVPVNLTHFDKEFGSLTLTLINNVNPKDSVPLSFRSIKVDGKRGLESGHAKGKATFTFLRPITETDRRNTMPQQQWNAKEVDFTDRCAKEVWAKRPDMLLHHVTPTMFGKTLPPEMYLRSNGNWAILIYSGTPPEPNKLVGDTFTIRCEFASNGIGLSVCKGVYQDCYD
jgi:hypothetical protein